MSCRILIENPAPFTQALRGPNSEQVDVSMDEGVEVVRNLMASGLQFAGIHHSDLDPYEVKQMKGGKAPPRFDSLDYACYVNEQLGEQAGDIIPHRVIVYREPEEQLQSVRRLLVAGIHDLVLVGTPFHTPPASVVYRNSVEQMLTYLRSEISESELRLGFIVLHERRDEPARLRRKLAAAGSGRVRLMGQFLDNAGSMPIFLDATARELEASGRDFGDLEWNVGLAMFTLKRRDFYAKLLRKPQLDCEPRFAGLRSTEARIAESVAMNLEFAERLMERGSELGFDIGFSLQPIIERTPNGLMHPGMDGIVQLGKALHARFG
jgi:hypothetical protein